MSILIQDLKLALRQLGRRPIFASTAVLTLAIGISANAVAFTVVNGILFKGSATSAEKNVGRIVTLPGGDESGYASLPEYERFAEATRGAVDLAAEGRTAVGWRHKQTTEIAWALFVSPNYFSMVKARPLLAGSAWGARQIFFRRSSLANDSGDGSSTPHRWTDSRCDSTTAT